MNGALYLTSFKAASGLGCRIVGSMDYGYIAVFILFTACAGYKVRVHQAHLVAGEHTEVFLRRLLHKVFAFDIKLSAKRNLTAAQCFVFQVIRSVQILDLVFRIVVDHKLHRINDCHHSGAF